MDNSKNMEPGIRNATVQESPNKEQSFKESFKKQTGIDAFDDPELSMFDDALEFLRTKDQYSFVEGKPIQKVCGYSEKEKIDSFKELDTLNKPRVRYRGTKKFK